jgi:hypothetical protein
MIRLHQTFGAHAGRTLSFDKDVVTLGRLPESDVAFDPRADLDASGRHAELRREDGRWFVVDVGSRNGTYVDGERVQRAPLATGNVLELGKGGPRIRVELVEAVAQVPAAARADIGLLATAQWDPRTPMAGGAPAGGPALRSVGQPPSMPPTDPHASVPPSPVPAPAVPLTARPPSPTAGPPAPSLSAGPPSPAPPGFGGMTAGAAVGAAPLDRPTGLAPARRGGLGWGVPLLAVAFAAVFATAAVGVLVWRLWGATDPGGGVRRDVGGGAARPRLDPAEAPGALARSLGPAIYVVAARSGDPSEDTALCNAFAIRADVLATTARCVVAAQRLRAVGRRIVALQPGTDGETAVTALFHHPEFRLDTGAGPDLGVFTTGSALPVVVPLPPPAELVASLAAGGPVYVVHRPLDPAAAGPFSPEVTAEAGALAIPAPRASDGERAWAGWHTAEVAGRAAGAPVVDGAGMLLGLQCGVAERGATSFVRADVVAALLAGLGAR